MALFNTKFDSNTKLEEVVAGSRTIVAQPLNKLKDFASFEGTLVNPNQATINLFWTATGDYDPKIATKENTKLLFNDDVTCFFKDHHTIYVGGRFNTFNNKPATCNIVALNVDTLEHTKEDLNRFGPIKDGSSINCITKWKDLLIVGGDFEGDQAQSGVLGKGLSILDTANKKVYPFYVNGTVNAVCVKDNQLFVGGTFTFVNYSAQRASEYADLRVYCNGLFRVDLDLINSFSDLSINREYVERVSANFETSTELNTIQTIVSFEEGIIIGGSFNFKNSKSLAYLGVHGQDLGWNPIVNGTVNTVLLENNDLYVGGDFDFISTSEKYEASNSATKKLVNNILRYKISDNVLYFDETWNPKINGAVNTILLHEEILYVYGRFTGIGNTLQNYLAALDPLTEEAVWWPFNLQSGPIDGTNQNLLVVYDQLFVGGTFTETNNIKSNFFINLPLANKSDVCSNKIKLKIGAQSFSAGTSLVNETTTFVETEVNVGLPLTMNITEVSFSNKELNGCNTNTLVKFIVERNQDTFSGNFYLLGWNLN